MVCRSGAEKYWVLDVCRGTMLCTLLHYYIFHVTCMMVRSAWTLGPMSMRVVSIFAVTFCGPLCVHYCALRSRPLLTAGKHCVFDSFVGPIVSSRMFLRIKVSTVSGDSWEVTPKRRSLTSMTLLLFKGRLVFGFIAGFSHRQGINSHARPICGFEALATATLRDFAACGTIPESP